MKKIALALAVLLALTMSACGSGGKTDDTLSESSWTPTGEATSADGSTGETTNPPVESTDQPTDQSTSEESTEVIEQPAIELTQFTLEQLSEINRVSAVLSGVTSLVYTSELADADGNVSISTACQYVKNGSHIIMSVEEHYSDGNFYIEGFSSDTVPGVVSSESDDSASLTLMPSSDYVDYISQFASGADFAGWDAVSRLASGADFAEGAEITEIFAEGGLEVIRVRETTGNSSDIRETIMYVSPMTGLLLMKKTDCLNGDGTLVSTITTKVEYDSSTTVGRRFDESLITAGENSCALTLTINPSGENEEVQRYSVPRNLIVVFTSLDVYELYADAELTEKLDAALDVDRESASVFAVKYVPEADESAEETPESDAENG